MAKFSDLVKAFRENVRLGIPSDLAYDGKRIRLWTHDGSGFTATCERPKSYPKTAWEK